MFSRSDLLKRSARGDGYSPRGIRLRRFRLLFSFFPLAFIATCISCGSYVSGSQPVTVTVMPGSAQPFAGSNVQFTAMVQNSATSAVNWQVNKVTGGNLTVGMIDSTGLYAAPTSVPNPP